MGLIILKYSDHWTGIMKKVVKIHGFEKEREESLNPPFNMCAEYVEKKPQF
jgi:hypothetical protein